MSDDFNSCVISANSSVVVIDSDKFNLCVAKGFLKEKERRERKKKKKKAKREREKKLIDENIETSISESTCESTSPTHPSTKKITKKDIIDKSVKIKNIIDEFFG